MDNIKRNWDARQANLAGKQWEELIQRRANRENLLIMRIPNGCKQVSPTKLIRVKTPLDFVIFKNGKSAFFDAKSFDSDRIHHSWLTPHQIQMLNAISINGVRAGLLIWFRKINRVVFLDAQLLNALEPNQSAMWDCGLVLGSFEEFRLSDILDLSFETEPKPMTLRLS